jgi:hypothetical protein
MICVQESYLRGNVFAYSFPRNGPTCHTYAVLILGISYIYSHRTHIHTVCFFPDKERSRNSLVGIATGYGVDGWGSILLYFTASRPTSGPTHSHIQWATSAFSMGIKRLGREADHLPPSSAEVKNGKGILLLPHIHIFMVRCLTA